MSHLAIIAFVGTIVMCPRISVGHTFTGRVERVIDGDTIIIRVASASTIPTNRANPLACDSLQRVRLAEIDAPELKEPGGQESKQALSNMILHRQVSITWTHRGRYRRIIGQVHLDRRSINRELIAHGWAGPYGR